MVEKMTKVTKVTKMWGVGTVNDAFSVSSFSPLTTDDSRLRTLTPIADSQ